MGLCCSSLFCRVEDIYTLIHVYVYVYVYVYYVGGGYVDRSIDRSLGRLVD